MGLTATTWNPSDKGASVTLSGGDLTETSSGGSVRSVYGASSGRFYWEITPTVPDVQMVGVATSSADLSTWPGGDASGWTMMCSGLNVYNNASIVASPSSTPTFTTIGVLLDLDALTLTFLVDNTDIGLTVSIPSGTWYAVAGNTGEVTANFGATAMTYAPPVGFWAGFGLPDPPLIIAPSGIQALKTGTTALVEGPNRVSEVSGSYAFKPGTARVLLAEPQTGYPIGANALRAGTPSVIEGPNRVLQTIGASALKSGAASLQLGYPETLYPSGVGVLSVGTPTLLPYANKSFTPPGRLAFQAGAVSVLRAPVVPGAKDTVWPEGAMALHAGEPTLTAGGTTIQPSGALVLQTGTPNCVYGVRVAGSLVTASGTPSLGAVVKPEGSFVLHSGSPMSSVTLGVTGVSVFHSGAVVVSAGGQFIAPTGKSVCQFGTPFTSRRMRAHGSLAIKPGTPSLGRGATC